MSSQKNAAISEENVTTKQRDGFHDQQHNGLQRKIIVHVEISRFLWFCGFFKVCIVVLLLLVIVLLICHSLLFCC